MILSNKYHPIQKLARESETMLLNDYSYYILKESKIDPGKLIKSELRLICPRCKNEQQCPPYGETCICPECKLNMYIHGSELICFP